MKILNRINQILIKNKATRFREWPVITNPKSIFCQQMREAKA